MTPLISTAAVSSNLQTYNSYSFLFQHGVSSDIDGTSFVKIEYFLICQMHQVHVNPAERLDFTAEFHVGMRVLYTYMMVTHCKHSYDLSEHFQIYVFNP